MELRQENTLRDSVGLLTGHRALVTGGASGIGRATARRFAEEGAAVAVLDVDGDGAAAVAGEIDGIAGAVDVSDWLAVSRVVDEVVGELGGLSVVFNNAGVGSLSRLADYDVEEWRRVLSIDLDGAFHVLKATIPHLLAGGDGRVVNTASISGVRPSAGEGPYSAAKAGVAAITANAAMEYAPVIRVNAVSPGTILTALTAPAFEMMTHWEQVQLRRIPLARIGAPEDIADVVVFLCSDLSRYLTGQNLVVDGGMTLHGAGVQGILEYVEAKMAGKTDDEALSASEGRATP